MNSSLPKYEVLSTEVQAPGLSLGNDDAQRRLLHEIIDNTALSAVFQPVVDIKKSCGIIGYEALIRGPSNSSLHAPVSLFRTADQHGKTLEMERLCRKVSVETFVKQNLSGMLFLNVNPECLVHPSFNEGETLKYIHNEGLDPRRVVIELSENQPLFDYILLQEAVRHYRKMGFSIAIDDLGEYYSSEKFWEELRPEYIKLDKHFVQGINLDPAKYQFVASIAQMAKNAGTTIIAEGVETQAELAAINDIGIGFVQGNLLARPSIIPSVTVAPEIAKSLGVAAKSLSKTSINLGATARALLIKEVPISSKVTNKGVAQIFTNYPGLHSLPVVDNGIPIGLMKRESFFERYTRPFNQELFGRKSCTHMMDASPMVVDQGIRLQDLAALVVSSGRQYLFDGFIITENGKYLGMGTGQDLMREITEIQVNTARYANPLTLLPGNVPINEHIDMLLGSRTEFCACYCDLDNFKPFNDVYGYRKGDDIIQVTGDVLSKVCDPERDFIGHIGGDDFIILFQSPDWEQRCQSALLNFDLAVAQFFTEEHRKAGGYNTLDRRGNSVFHLLTSLSIGAIPVRSGSYQSHHEIAEAAAVAKKNAKKTAGSSLFIERRKES